MTCNVAAKKEASLRKTLKLTVLFGKPDEKSLHYHLVVCTINFQTEEVLYSTGQAIDVVSLD